MKFSCHCEKVFCPLHRLPEEHACSFDFKTMGKKQLTSENPFVSSNKFVKI